MPRRTAPHLRRVRGEGGSASIELVILFPALLLLVTALVEYGLWFHARSVALAAAQEGVAAARTYGSAPAVGRDTALGFVNEHGADTLLDATTTAGAAGVGLVQVTVTGRSVSVIPGLAGPTVTQSASGPVERFVSGGAP